jgi:glutaredoxin 3
MKDVEIFTGPGCAWCTRAKNLLNSRGIRFRERDVALPDVLDEFRARLPRVRSIPQVFIDGQHVGGFEDLERALA